MKLTDRIRQLAEFGVEVKGRDATDLLHDPGALLVFGAIVARFDSGEGVEFCVPSGNRLTVLPDDPVYRILVTEIGRDEADSRTSKTPGRGRSVLVEDHVILDLQAKLRYELVLPSREYLGIGRSGNFSVRQT